MGTDIHCFVEKKINGKWKKISGFVSDLFSIDSEWFRNEKYRNSDSPIYLRNYDMFAILADIRNGISFAGMDSGDRIEPISEPKGLPPDVSNEIKRKSDNYGLDGHSHSWLTVKEIVDYDLSKRKIKRGYVTVEKYKDFIETGDPYPCCVNVSGGKTIKFEDPDEAIEYKNKHPDIHVYTRIEWSETIYESVGVLYTHALPQLIERCESENYDDVRIVFRFDN